MPAPTDVEGIRRICGMAQYMSRFIPDLAGTLEPIALTRKGVPFVWSKECENAFNALKKNLSESACLAYYDPSKELVIQVDSSKHGLGRSAAPSWPSHRVHITCPDPIRKKLGADRKRSTSCPIWSQKIRPVHVRPTNNRRKRPQTSGLNTKQSSKHGPKTSSRHNDALQPIRCQLRIHQRF